jgi:hypothetical protein
MGEICRKVAENRYISPIAMLRDAAIGFEEARARGTGADRSNRITGSVVRDHPGKNHHHEHQYDRETVGVEPTAYPAALPAREQR